MHFDSNPDSIQLFNLPLLHHPSISTTSLIWLLWDLPSINYISISTISSIIYVQWHPIEENNSYVFTDTNKTLFRYNQPIMKSYTQTDISSRSEIYATEINRDVYKKWIPRKRHSCHKIYVHFFIFSIKF